MVIMTFEEFEVRRIKIIEREREVKRLKDIIKKLEEKDNNSG
mgnify:FL=1